MPVVYCMLCLPGREKRKRSRFTFAKLESSQDATPPKEHWTLLPGVLASPANKNWDGYLRFRILFSSRTPGWKACNKGEDSGDDLAGNSLLWRFLAKHSLCSWVI